MTPPNDSPLLDRYGRVVLAWVLGVLGPAVGVLVALMAAAEARCDSGATDCSWGLEALVVIPVALLSCVTFGPLAIYLALRWAKDPWAARTTGFALALVLPSVALSFIGGIALLVGPPLGGRYLVMRNARTRLEKDRTEGPLPAA